MKTFEIEKAIRGYINEVAPNSEIALRILNKEKTRIEELSRKLSKIFNKSEEVDNYLDDIVEIIENLNKFFKKKGSGRVSFSNILKFANKDERISDFILDRAIAEKRNGKMGKEERIAGFDIKNDDDNLAGYSVPFKGKDYSFIFLSGSYMFLFSPVTRKVVVQVSGGLVESYLSYKKRCEDNEENPIGKLLIYKELRKIGNFSDIQKMFMIYIRQERAKIARRNNKKRTIHS